MQAQNTQAPPANIKKATPVLTVDPNTNRSFTLPANATKQPQVPADTGQSKNVLQGNAPKKQ